MGYIKWLIQRFYPKYLYYEKGITLVFDVLFLGVLIMLLLSARPQIVEVCLNTTSSRINISDFVISNITSV